jgi:NAD(P)-dependent dehydrogenase (short-subunit alcohol dehydrogenase family)
VNAPVNSKWDCIDILVLCASVQVRQPLAAVDAQTLAIQRRINFDSTFELLQAVLPSMSERRFGRVISKSRCQDAAERALIQRSANPMHRAGTPEEVAQITGLLAAHASAFITGADIAVDGGGRL